MFSYLQYLYLFIMGAFSFFVAFLVGGALNLSTGIPLTGGIANGIVVGLLLTLGVKGVNRFGAAIVIWLVFSTLAVPTNTLGPPHLLKIAVGGITGLLWDVVIFLFRRKNKGYAIGGAVGSCFIVIGLYSFSNMLGLDPVQKERMGKWLVELIILNATIGFISTYIGTFIFDKKFADTPWAHQIAGKSGNRS